jgi:hypothetical protein
MTASALIETDTGKVVSAKSVKLFPDILNCQAKFVEPPFQESVSQREFFPFECYRVRSKVLTPLDHRFPYRDMLDC